MSSINWSEVLAIFLGFAAFFIYLMNRLDGLKKELTDKIEAFNKSLNDKIDASNKSLNDKIDASNKSLNDKIDASNKSLNDKIDASNKSLSDKIEMLQKDINHVESKVSNIEGQITQMTRPNVIPIRDHFDDHPKEN